MNIFRTIFLTLIIVTQASAASHHTWLTHNDLYKGGVDLFSRVSQNDAFKQTTAYGSWLRDKAWEHRVPLAGCLLGGFVAKRLYDEHYNRAIKAEIYNPAPKAFKILPYQLQPHQGTKLLQALPAHMRYVALAKQRELEELEKSDDQCTPIDPAVNFLKKEVYFDLQKRHSNRPFPADLMEIKLPGQDCFVYSTDMNKQGRHYTSIVKNQSGLDCGFHATFNGIQLFNYAQGRIDRTTLEDRLQNFDVDQLKQLCNEKSYINSATIEDLMHIYNLNPEDYSIIESVETVQFTMTVIPKLACNLFDPNVANYHHILILHSRNRMHWTVAVVHKKDNVIHMYTADSLRGLNGNNEDSHGLKILQLAADAKATRPELETLYSIENRLQTINNGLCQEPLPHLMYILQDIYTNDCLKIPYFLEHFQQRLLKHLQAVQNIPPVTENVKTVLMLLSKAIRYSALLTADLLEVNFTEDRTTEAEKMAFLVLLDVYRMQNRLHKIPDLNEHKDEIHNEITILEDIGIYNAFTELKAALNNATA